MKPHLPELEGLGRSLDSCYETLEVIRMGQAGYPRMLIDRTKMIVLLSTEISGRLPAYEFASALSASKSSGSSDNLTLSISIVLSI